MDDGQSGRLFRPIQLERLLIRWCAKPITPPRYWQTARTVPTINYPGRRRSTTLDENLMASLTGAKTAAQAMAIPPMLGRRSHPAPEKIIEAIKANKAAWPTVLDPV